MLNKKGILPVIGVTVTVGILLALALVVAVLFGGAAFFTWVLSKSIFYLAGIGIIIAGIILATRGKILPMWLWIIGGILVVLPYLFKTIEGATLAVILG